VVCEQAVPGWIYGLENGLLRDLSMTVAGADETSAAYQAAIAALA
jgi:carbonic anhydrase